jgi:hypothetical protein
LKIPKARPAKKIKIIPGIGTGAFGSLGGLLGCPKTAKGYKRIQKNQIALVFSINTNIGKNSLISIKPYWLNCDV